MVNRGDGLLDNTPDRHQGGRWPRDMTKDIEAIGQVFTLAHLLEAHAGKGGGGILGCPENSAGQRDVLQVRDCVKGGGVRLVVREGLKVEQLVLLQY